MEFGKQMRHLDGLLQKDRHKIKIFGLTEKVQGENYTEETGPGYEGAFFSYQLGFFVTLKQKMSC